MTVARNPGYNYADLMRRMSKRLHHRDAIVCFSLQVSRASHRTAMSVLGQVVLKALIVYHRCMHETFPGSPRFTEKLLPSIKDFNLKTFLNKRTPEGMLAQFARCIAVVETSIAAWEASIMVQQYACYLEEKICFVRDYHYEYEQESPSEQSRCLVKTLRPLSPEPFGR